jgi:hypothetical protein
MRRSATGRASGKSFTDALEPGATPGGRRTGALIAAALIAVALILRLSAAFNDLWLDELWSLAFARRASSPADLLLRIQHDNNHPLNTLWMYLLGQDAPGFMYRLPAVLAGTGAVILAGRIARPRGELTARLAITLTAFSYLLIHYASEARGYSLALFFAFLGFLYLEQFLATRRTLPALGFGLSGVAGLLAHLTYLQFSVGALVWSAMRIGQERASLGQRVRALVACHLLPLGFLLWLYLVQIRRMAIGGGDPRSLSQVIPNAVALAVGAPPDHPITLAAAAGAALLFAAGLAALQRQGSDRWIFFLATVLLGPGLLLALHREVVFERYFLMSAAFMLLPVSMALGDLRERGGMRQAAGALALTGILAGNMSLVARLQRDGRGAYREALAFIAACTPGDPISLASDHDFRNGVLIDYYRHTLPGRQIIYYARGAWPATGPDWFIAHRQSAGADPPRTLTMGPAQYRLAKVTRYSLLSGWDWYIYRKSPPSSARPLPTGSSEWPK